MMIVTGVIQARLDTLDELRRLSLEHVARSRVEPGCLEHGVTIDANDGLRLVFFERWVDHAAFEAHVQQPATREFAAQARRLAAHPPEIVAYDEFAYFHENAEEFGLPYSGPPVVRRESVDLGDDRRLSALVWGSAAR